MIQHLGIVDEDVYYHLTRYGLVKFMNRIYGWVKFIKMCIISFENFKDKILFKNLIYWIIDIFTFSNCFFFIIYCILMKKIPPITIENY